MTQFKRNSSSKFSRPSGNSNSNSGGGEQRSSGGRSEGRSSGGRSSGGNGGGKKDFAFTNLGSITVPKSASDEMNDIVHNELKGSEIKLNVKIYPPKGVESVTLNRDDLLLITFKVGEKDPEFVVGKVLIPNN